MDFHATPLKLAPERAWRTYLGGSLLDRLHGVSGGGDGHFPEEWIMSVVTARNAGREDIVEGLSRLADNPAITLQQLVEDNPAAMLGEEHVKKHGPVPGVLVKLIDAAERLTTQVHPDKARAKLLFGSDYGKTECWHILGGRTVNGEAPHVYLGFREGVTRECWKELFERQDIAGMLDAMHRFDVRPGDTILIEGGVPHAIGAGCFLAEIQEPTDYTIRIERVTPSGFPVAETMCHQGLGFERMFDCFDYDAVGREEARERWFVRPERGMLIGHDRCSCFSLARIVAGRGEEVLIPRSSVFSGLYALEGSGQLVVEDGGFLLERGAQYFLPAALPAFSIRNTGEVPLTLLRFFGPA